MQSGASFVRFEGGIAFDKRNCQALCARARLKVTELGERWGSFCLESVGCCCCSFSISLSSRGSRFPCLLSYPDLVSCSRVLRGKVTLTVCTCSFVCSVNLVEFTKGLQVTTACRRGCRFSVPSCLDRTNGCEKKQREMHADIIFKVLNFSLECDIRPKERPGCSKIFFRTIC